MPEKEYTLRCPLCAKETIRRVIDSHQCADGTRRRRRSCVHCGESWTTYEVHRDELLRLRADSAQWKLILAQAARREQQEA